MTKNAFSLLNSSKEGKKSVKILRFHCGQGGFNKAEKELAKLVNDGWVIVTCSGGVEVGSGFVILQKD